MYNNNENRKQGTCEERICSLISSMSADLSRITCETPGRNRSQIEIPLSPSPCYLKEHARIWPVDRCGYVRVEGSFADLGPKTSSWPQSSQSRLEIWDGLWRKNSLRPVSDHLGLVNQDFRMKYATHTNVYWTDTTLITGVPRPYENALPPRTLGIGLR